MSFLPEDDSERGGWGPFSLPVDHPFQPSFQMHDRIFGSRERGFVGGFTRYEADRLLLDSMLRIARERKSTRLRAEAYVYYGLARAFGSLFW